MSIVDERIVKMVFDNAEFAGKIASTIGSLTQLNKATEQVANNSGGGLSAMGKAFEQAEMMSTKAGFHIKDVWLKVASILEYQVAGKIVKIGKDIANAMTFEGIADGFKEYELKMGSIQTIMAGTGESLQTVNKYLDELNTYSDKTIYSFADMTNNIGKFTNAGVKLEDAVLAIKGIANEAARSGANANEASRAMYNFSQALSAGYVKLIDWKSIENANMATKEFKDTLLEVATAVGTVEKGEDGMYKVLSKNAQGATMKEAISGTKNFNDSLAYQWMTTDVLTKTMKIYATDVRDLSKAEKEAFEAELRTMGFNEQQIKQFENLGSASTDAASEIKTFTMLIDTLKEAIGSGWAMTWQLLIGDFEEAKALWTQVGKVLSKIIDDSSDARNKLIEGWRSLGGRQDLIDALGNSFKFLMSVIRPIGTALKEVFPPTTRSQLYKLTKGFKEFTESLHITTRQADQIRIAFKGFFSIFDIALKFVGAFIKAILPAGKGIGSLGGDLLKTAENIGAFITKLDESITKGKVFEKFFENIGKIVGPVFEIIKAGAKGLITILGELFSGFNDATKPMKNVGDVFRNVVDNISNGIKNIKERLDKLSPIFEGIKSLVKGVGTVIGTIFSQIGNTISGFSLGGNGITDLVSILNALLTGGILYKLYNSVKTFSAFSDILDNLGEVLGGFQEKIQSETLMNTAKAIAILAGSLFIVAMIDSDKLAGATTAISVMVASLAGAMTLMMKAISSFSATEVKNSFKIFGKELFSSSKAIEMAITLQAVSKALIAMGAAILMMSVGLKVVSSAAEGGHLWDSFAVISLMLAELTGVAIVLGKWGNDSKKGTQGLISMTAALILMATALKMVSGVVEGGNAWESLAIIGLMVAGLTGVMIAIDKLTKYKAMSMLPLISMAISINLLVIALKSISDALGTEGQHIWQALGIVGLMVAGLAAVCVVLSKFAAFSALGGLGAIMAAAALLILVQSLKQISDALGQTNQHVWQALGVIAVSLLVLAVGLTAMAATLPGSAALLIASVALTVLAGALKIMGTMKLEDVGKALIAMAGSLLLLAVGLTAMIVALPGAVALTVAALGLTVLASALKIFGSMSLGEIVKSLGMLVVALAGIATISTVLSIASPFILIFSASLLVFGAALISTGVGLTLFATGLSALIPILPMAATAINVLGTALLSLLPVIVEQLMNALGMLAAKIIEFAPTFTQATIAIIDSILTAVVASQIRFGEAVLQLILGILQVLTENIPLIAQAGTDLMIAYMQAISTEIPRVVEEAYKCAIALVEGLAAAIEKNNGELIEAVDHLMNAVIQAITQWLVEFTPLGLLIPEEMKDGIMSGEHNVKDAIDNTIKGAVEAIKKKWNDFKQAAEFLISGLIEGLRGTAVGRVVSAAADLGNKVIGGLTSKKGLDENSPSLRAWLAGLFVGKGLEGGLDESAEGAQESAANLGNGTINALDGSLKDGIPGVESTVDGIGDTITGTLNDSIQDGIPDIERTTTKLTNSAVKPMNSAMKETIDISDDARKAYHENKKALQELSKETEHTTEVTKELGTESMRAEQRQRKFAEATDKNTLAQKYNVQAMQNAHDKAATLHERQQEVKNSKIDFTTATKKNTEVTEENTKAQEENATATGKSGKAAKSSANVMEYASGVVEAFTKNYGHLYSSLGEDAPVKVATFAIKNLAEETYKASLKAKQAAGENEKTKVSIEEMIKSFTELKTKIYDSVKSVFEGDNFFQKFETKTETSMASVLENMRSNINGVRDWSNKITELGNRGVNEGLLKQLAELGPKSNEYVNAWSTATDEQIAEANALFAESATLSDSISNDVVASYAKAGLNVVAGFANGIDQNAYMALESNKNLGETGVKQLEAILEEESPSKRTYRDGMYLVMGLTSGIKNYSYLAHNAAVTLAMDIIKVIGDNLAESKFYEYGKNVAFGLAAGMTSDEALKKVQSAANRISEIADKAIQKYNEIKSPSKLYKRYGGYIAEGLALGMIGGESYVEHGAYMLSEAVKNTLDVVESIAENDMTISPVISPVLDLNNLRTKANTINSLFPGQSMALAASIGIGSSNGSSGSSTEATPIPGAQQINFTQNNYSPKALSRYEIYRDTKNTISMMKGVIANA